VWAGYPASMVGVNPPTPAAVTFGIAQCGLALLLRGPLARWMRRPLAWATVALANLSAMTLFLWHQTAYIAVNSLGMLAGRVPGLLTAPSGPAWVAERICWLPVFATALAGLWLAFRRLEHGGSGRRGLPGRVAVRPGLAAGGQHREHRPDGAGNRFEPGVIR